MYTLMFYIFYLIVKECITIPLTAYHTSFLPPLSTLGQVTPLPTPREICGYNCLKYL